MQTKSTKFWAYIAALTGILLMLSGIAAAVGYLGLPVMLPFEDALSYELGNIAALYLGLFGGTLAVYHGIGSISGRASSVFKLPSFYVFWIVLALSLGLGNLVLNADLATDYLFPPLFVLGAALSTFAVLAWALRGLGWPLTWRQTALAFVCGSTLSILVAILLEGVLPYLAYLLIAPLDFMAEEFAGLGWGAPGFVERLFASPLILVYLIFTAFQAPLPEEFAKALGVPMFGQPRITNERQAFAIGLASGAGFAILENMLYEGLYAQHNGWSWGGVTLLRSIGAVLHPLCTGIVALGWFRTQTGGKAALLKAYLLAVLLHTLWNGGFEPLVYLTGLDYYAGAGPSFSIYGETLNILLIGYLVLLSAGLWWLLRQLVTGLFQNAAAISIDTSSSPSIDTSASPSIDTSSSLSIDLSPALVSRRALAAWALACAGIIIPIGATLSPAWESIQKVILGK